MRRAARTTTVLLVAVALLAACGRSPGGARTVAAAGRTTLTVSAIPDQDPQVLQRRFGAFASYLGNVLHVSVRYVPVTDYTASVAAFRRGDLDLVFFGGLTGVQARLQVPGAQILAQRDIDAAYRSVFIANTGSGIQPVTDVAGLRSLVGHTFTFGSETSTSGRLMPQYFLSQAGVALTDFQGQPGFSGSHDTTWKLVEAGTYQAGVLSTAVWDQRLKDGSVDVTKVRELFRTPTFHDYHWLIRPDVDARMGAGFTQRVKDALLAMDGSNEQQRQVLQLFLCSKFIAAQPQDYQQVEAAGRADGLIK